MVNKHYGVLIHSWLLPDVHVFYVKKMGEKYLERYKKYFKNPVIHEQDMRHEEFLGVYPDEWCELVKDICLER